MDDPTQSTFPLDEVLEAMFDHSATGLALMRGPQFTFEKVNRKWTELVSERKYVGVPWRDVYPEVGPTLPLLLSEVYRTGMPFHAHEMKLPVKTDRGVVEDRFYDFSYFRISGNESWGVGIFCQCSNVTERVMARRRLESTGEELRQERDHRDHFVATLMHDLRTPLSGAKMGAQLLARKMPDPTVLHSVGQIVSSLDRMETMVRNALDANRIKAGRGIPISVKACDFVEIIARAVNELQRRHAARFVVRYAAGSIPGAWDPEAVQRLIENLATTVVKSGGDELPITIASRVVAQTVELSVHSEGDPISPGDGRLALVAAIAKAHHGGVRVENEGKTYVVTLPLDTRRQMPLDKGNELI